MLGGIEEVVEGVSTNAGFAVWRNVGGIDGAQGRQHRQTAGEGLAPKRRVAGHAISRARHIFTARNERGVVDIDRRVATDRAQAR
ncbi:hypothetical protein D3C77_633870 [compost metagenome]